MSSRFVTKGIIMKGIANVFRSTSRALRLGMPTVLAVACVLPARLDAGDRRPHLPLGCEKLEVSSQCDVSLHAFAQGVQIYRFDVPTNTWVFVAPDATLYADAGFHGRVGSHFAGPTWQSDSGSNVVGKKIEAATPDPTAIPWLLLSAVSSHGPGPLDHTTYIQRVNTLGGLAPDSPGTPDEIARVPYTAEYYFYRVN